MKKYSLIIFSIILPVIAFAQVPSFEVYAPGGNSFPTITNVNVIKESNTVIVTADAMDISGVYTVKSIIKDSYGRSVNGGTTLMSWYNEATQSYTTSVCPAGQICHYMSEYDVSPYYAGTYTVDISATDIFTNSGIYINQGNFTISGPTFLTLFIDPANVYQGEPVNFKAFLYDGLSNPLIGEPVNFYFNNNYVGTSNIQENPDLHEFAAEFTFNIPESQIPQVYEIKAVYDGNPFLGFPAEALGYVEVLDAGLCSTSEGTRLCAELQQMISNAALENFYASPASVEAGSSTNIYVTLKKSDGTLAGAGYEITFTDVAKGLLGSAVTNSSGVANLVFNVPLSWFDGGGHYVTASFAGDPAVGGPASTSRTLFSVTSPPGTCKTSFDTTVCENTTFQSTQTQLVNLTAIPSATVAPGSLVTFRVTLQNQSGAPIYETTVPIKFYLNGTTLIGTDTDGTTSLGFAFLTNYVAPQTPGSYTITAVFEGDPSIGPGATSDPLTLMVGSVTGWQYRKKITISNINVVSNLTNFPVMVRFNADQDIGAHAINANGNDIRFVNYDGVPLKYEKEWWSPGVTSLAPVSGVFWVKIPTVYSSPTGNQNTFYIYYGNASATDAQTPAEVWDSNYKAVYHFSALPLLDSTANNKDQVSSTGNITFETVSFGSGQALKFTPGVNWQYQHTNCARIAGPANDIIGNTSFTISSYLVPDPVSVWWPVEGAFSIGKYETNKARSCAFIGVPEYNSFPGLTGGFFGTDPLYSQGTTSTSPAHIALRHEANVGANVYINGSSAISYAFGIYPPDLNSGNISIGGMQTSESSDYYYCFSGSIDEARISNIARSPAWIRFERASMLMTTYTWGIQENL